MTLRRGVAVPAVLVLVAVAAGLAACARTPARPPSGSSRPDRVTAALAADGVQVVDLDAGNDYRFHPSEVDARVGRIRLTLHHVGIGAPHTWSAPDIPKARGPLVQPGESQTLSFTVTRPGTYRFVCTIHERQGQVGRLVVSPAGSP